jgi:lipopolysaccharide/colanic/teichoic acid biosynthesis glycosyltransferase
MLIDALTATAALVVALWLWSLTTGFSFGVAFVVERMVWFVAVPVWLVIIAPTRALQSSHSMAATGSGLISAAAGLLVAYLALYFYAPPSALARLPAVYFVWETLLLTSAGRLAYLFVLGAGKLRRPVGVVGGGARAAAARDLLGNAPDVVLCGTDVDPDVLVRNGAAELILAVDGAPSAALGERLLRLQEQGIEVVPFAVEYEHRLQRVPVEFLDADWPFTSLPDWIRSRDTSAALKRALDVSGAAVGLVVLVAMLLPVAALIWLDSGRPIFFRQRRVGRAGRLFLVIKFRTMAVGAEPDGARFASPFDPRVTRVGRWLRRSRIDELPQVLNVLSGEMSLVGPRPERPEFSDDLAKAIPFYRTRLTVAPGLTGWAQVNAEYGDSVSGQSLKLEYDLYYIKHRSLAFDLRVLVRTISTVAGLRGR